MFEIKSEAENAHQQVWAFTVEPPPLLISLQILANSFFSNQLSPQLSNDILISSLQISEMFSPTVATVSQYEMLAGHFLPVYTDPTRK